MRNHLGIQFAGKKRKPSRHGRQKCWSDWKVISFAIAGLLIGGISLGTNLLPAKYAWIGYAVGVVALLVTSCATLFRLQHTAEGELALIAERADDRLSEYRKSVAIGLEALWRMELMADEHRVACKKCSTADDLESITSPYVEACLKWISSSLLQPLHLPVSLMAPESPGGSVLKIAFDWPTERNADRDFEIAIEELGSRNARPVNGEGVAGHAFASGNSYLIPHITRDEYCILTPTVGGEIARDYRNGSIWKMSNRSNDFDSLLSVPIRFRSMANQRDEVHGVLSIEYPNYDAFEDEDVWFAWATARILGRFFASYRSCLERLSSPT